VVELVKRFEAEGEAGLAPQSRRPRSSPQRAPAEVEEKIVELRKQLTEQGLDAGAETIRVHLQRHPAGARVPAVSTIWRILTRRGSSRRSRRSDRGRPMSGSRRRCPTSGGELLRELTLDPSRDYQRQAKT
jgi:hypothetical protein